MNTNNVTAVNYTLISTHSAVASNSNPLPLTLSTATDLNERNQYYAILTMSTPTVTTYLDFNITFPTVYNIRFYAKDILDGNSFYTSAAEPTVSLNLDRIAQLISSNPTLASYYSVEKISNTELKITARQPGTLYNLNGVVTCSAGLSLSYNSFTNFETAAGEGQKISDLFFFVDVYCAPNNYDNSGYVNNVFTTPPDNLFQQVDKLKKPYNATNAVSFDLAPVINTFLNQNNLTLRPNYISDLQLQLVENISHASCHYKVNVGVQYSRLNSDIGVEQVYHTIEDLKAYHATLPIGSINDFRHYVTIDSFRPTVPFLTNRTSPIVKRFEYVVLYFYTTQEYDSMQLRGYITFTDGTSTATVGSITSYETFESIANVGANLYRVLFKVDSLVAEAESVNNKIARNFGIVICADNSATPITEQRHYQIDNQDYEYQYNFIYQNSLGGYDHFMFTATSDSIPEIARTFYQDTSLIDYRNGDKKTATEIVQFQNTRRYSSNYIDQFQYADLKELIKSRNVYQVIDVDNANTYTYQYNSNELLQESVSGTAWTTEDAGTSGTALYKSVTIDASPTTSRRLYVYAPYFPSGDQAFTTVNNFVLKIGPLTTTFLNGATNAGTLTVRFGAGITTMLQTFETQTVDLRQGTHTYEFYYNNQFEAQRIDFRIEAVQTGDDEVRYDFLDLTKAFTLIPITKELKYVYITEENYTDSDNNDLKEVLITVRDTINETNL